MTDFATRLKTLRTNCGMTQEEVASALFVTKQAVSKWENGNGLPDVATLGKLADLFDVNIDFLLTGNDNVKIEKEVEIVEKEKIVEIEKPLTEEDKERLLYKFNYIEMRLHAGYFLIGICSVVFVCLVICLSYAAIVPAIGLIVAIPCTIYNNRLYKKEKIEIEKYNLNPKNKTNNKSKEDDPNEKDK